MKLTITMELDNAAFCDQDDGAGGVQDNERNGDAVADVLRKLACGYGGVWLTAGDTETVRDTNGNRIGEATVTG